ncbi:hypothetical protein D3C72_1783260 [compost metagenome]
MLALVFGPGLAQVQLGARQQLLQARQRGGLRRLRQHQGQGRFPRTDPVLHQLRVVDQKRGHSQPGRVADPQVAL